jgi:hypothetical protein
MKKLITTSGALTLAYVAFMPLSWGAPAATLLFTQAGTQIVAENGVVRSARRGDVIQTGERLRTPAGAISQLRLPDGSLIGMRPDSELKIDLPPAVTDGSLQTVSLLQGAARVIGVELMDSKQTSKFTFQSGLATLRLKGADLESAIVKADPGKLSAATDPGSYSRLLTGTGSIGSGALVEPLALRQVSFVGAINVAPTTVTSVSPNLFAAPLPVMNTGLLSTIGTTKTVTPVAPLGAVNPAITTVAPITTSLLVQPISPTVTVAPVTTLAIAPVLTMAPMVTVSPILTTPIAPITTTTKLPLLSCKVLKTC